MNPGKKQKEKMITGSNEHLAEIEARLSALEKTEHGLPEVTVQLIEKMGNRLQRLERVAGQASVEGAQNSPAPEQREPLPPIPGVLRE
jgi:hypothetical protein